MYIDSIRTWSYKRGWSYTRGWSCIPDSTVTLFNSGAEICKLGSQRHLFSTTSHFWLYLPNTEIPLALEVNKVEVKGLTSLASVTWITASTIEHVGGEGIGHALRRHGAQARQKIETSCVLVEIGVGEVDLWWGGCLENGHVERVFFVWEC
jgi:hypothetical protein